MSSLYFTISQSLLWFMSIESVMLSNHLILGFPLLLLPSVFPSIRVFSNESPEHWRLSTFKLWCWRRLLSIPWTARRSNQSILKGISPKYSLEGLMLKQKLQYFGHLMRTPDSLEKTLMLGKTEGKRRRGQQRMRWLESITYSVDTNLSTPGDSEGQGSLACYSSWRDRGLDMT